MHLAFDVLLTEEQPNCNIKKIELMGRGRERESRVRGEFMLHTHTHRLTKVCVCVCVVFLLPPTRATHRATAPAEKRRPQPQIGPARSADDTHRATDRARSIPPTPSRSFRSVSLPFPCHKPCSTTPHTTPTSSSTGAQAKCKQRENVVYATLGSPIPTHADDDDDDDDDGGFAYRRAPSACDGIGAMVD